MKAVDHFIETWQPEKPHERAVFRDSFHAMLGDVFDKVERRAEARFNENHGTLGHEYYSAVRAVRKELGCERKT